MHAAAGRVIPGLVRDLDSLPHSSDSGSASGGLSKLVCFSLCIGTSSGLLCPCSGEVIRMFTVLRR